MGIITGFICLFCFCILLLKALSRKMNLHHADRILMKLHKPVSALLLVCGPAHILSVISVLQMRNALVSITGILAIAVYILLIFLCHTQGSAGKLQTPDSELINHPTRNATEQQNIQHRRRSPKNICKHIYGFMIRGNKLRCHRIMSAVMLLCIVDHITVWYMDYTHYRQQIAAVRLQGIDLSLTSDGNYTGEYDAGYIYAKVTVSVVNGTITDIRILKHHHERGITAEQITENIIAEQRTDIDAISGATNSSRVIQQAVENALLR